MGTSQGTMAVPRGWEGNRRSGFAPAERHTG